MSEVETQKMVGQLDPTFRQPTDYFQTAWEYTASRDEAMPTQLSLAGAMIGG